MEPTNFDLSEGETSQYLRDFKLAIEFKYLMSHAPGGVYLMPEIDDMRKLHGVIFIRWLIVIFMFIKLF